MKSIAWAIIVATLLAVDAYLSVNSATHPHQNARDMAFIFAVAILMLFWTTLFSK